METASYRTMRKNFSIEIKFIHVILTRWDSQEEVSVTVSSSGYIVDARSEFGHQTELTELESQSILKRLGLDDDDDCY